MSQQGEGLLQPTYEYRVIWRRKDGIRRRRIYQTKYTAKRLAYFLATVEPDPELVGRAGEVIEVDVQRREVGPWEWT